MKLRRLGVTAAALGLAAAVVVPSAAASPSASTSAGTGTRSLAEVLTSDGDTFDRNWYDYDIVTEAVLAVLADNRDSKVGLLTDGTVPLTAFIPNDRAFQVLARDLTGTWPRTEQKTFTALVDAVGVAAIEQVLLYHVVPGDAITKRAATKADGAELTTAQGGTFTVRVYNRHVPIIELRDQDRNDVNPFLNPRALDINKGNKQIAHGIVFVLRPLDL
ncbi:MAG TPA: fasciclin domain-containing protein [Ornithinibacter sp.]|nr:fasciclin domain-containing protein [Ornithinibacter sp.]